jgi:hypothetical protein
VTVVWGGSEWRATPSSPAPGRALPGHRAPHRPAGLASGACRLRADGARPRVTAATFQPIPWSERLPERCYLICSTVYPVHCHRPALHASRLPSAGGATATQRNCGHADRRAASSLRCWRPAVNARRFERTWRRHPSRVRLSGAKHQIQSIHGVDATRSFAALRMTAPS